LEPRFAHTVGLDYLSNLKMTSVRFSETLVSIYPTARCHIPDDTTHINHRRENPSS